MRPCRSQLPDAITTDKILPPQDRKPDLYNQLAVSELSQQLCDRKNMFAFPILLCSFLVPPPCQG